MIKIDLANLADGDVRDLVTVHQRHMYESSPPGTSFALDLSGLERPQVAVFAARDSAGALMGIGALMELSPTCGEIKSMRTAERALRRGVAQRLLDHMTEVSRQRGYSKLMLETGVGSIFEPANKLYIRNGFTRRGPFADYKETDFNIFYERSL